MAEAYPEALRTRVVSAYEAGEGSYATIALQCQLGTATVKRWVAQHRREGHVRPCRKAGGTASGIRSADLEALLVVLGDPTAGELTAAYNRRRRGRARVHVSSMKRALHRNDYVVKKNAAGRRRWHGRPSRPSDGGS
jgi:transposase